MAKRVWTAAELERLTPSEQNRLFESSIIRDLDQVPAEFLDRVRSRIAAQVEDATAITES